MLLLADDDLVRSRLRKSLTHFGSNAIKARDGREGLRPSARAQANRLMADNVSSERQLRVLTELRQGSSSKSLTPSGGGRKRARKYFPSIRLLGAAEVTAKPVARPELITASHEVLPGWGSPRKALVLQRPAILVPG